MRAIQAAVLIVLAVPLLVFTAATGMAAWRVTPELWVGMGPGTSDLALLREAGELAGGEASYHGFAAGALLNAARGAADPTTRARLLAEAARSADRAIDLMPTSPTHRRVAGAIAIATAKQASASERGAYAQLALARMRQGRERQPASALNHQQIGMELVRGWDVIGIAGREETIAAVRMATELDAKQLASSLQVLRAYLGLERTIELVDELAGESGAAWLVAAREFDRWAEVVPAIAERGLIGTAALDAYDLAVERGGLEAATVDSWASAWERLDGDDVEGFTRAAEDLLQRHPQRVEAWLALAVARQRGDDAELAGAALESALVLARQQAGQTGSPEHDPGAVPVLLLALQRHAEHAFATRDYETALADYTQLARLEADEVYWRLGQGRCLDRLGRSDEALVAYQAAVRVAPRSRVARSDLADVYMARAEPLEAIGQWRAIVAMRPGNTRYRLSLARTYRDLGLQDQAIRYYTELLEMEPDHEAARSEMGELVGGVR